MGGQGVHQPGFAAAGLACGEQVLVDDADVDRVAEFVDAHVDGVEHGQHRPDRDSARGEGAGPVMAGSPLPEGGGTPGPVMPWGSLAGGEPAGQPGEAGGPVAGDGPGAAGSRSSRRCRCRRWQPGPGVMPGRASWGVRPLQRRRRRDDLAGGDLGQVQRGRDLGRCPARWRGCRT